MDKAFLRKGDKNIRPRRQKKPQTFKKIRFSPKVSSIEAFVKASPEGGIFILLVEEAPKKFKGGQGFQNFTPLPKAWRRKAKNLLKP
jgi:hypothetical protein